MSDGGGFVKIPWSMVQRSSDAELKILSVLCHYCSMPGGGFPSIETISREAGKQRRAVFRALHSLTEKGFIVKSNRSGQTSVYSFPQRPAAKRQEPPAEPPEGPDTRVKNDTGTGEGHPCQKRHTPRVKNDTQNKIDLIRLKQGQGHTRTRTRERRTPDKKHLESLISFQIRNPHYTPGADEPGRKFPFTEDGVNAIYTAGLKIGYRMTVAEVYKFAFVMLDGGITNRKGIFHPIRDFDSLLYSWRNRQTEEAARQAISEQERLKAGDPVDTGEIRTGEEVKCWTRLKPFPELSDMDPVREHPFYKVMQKGTAYYWRREYMEEAERAFDALTDEEKARALKIIEGLRADQPGTCPTQYFRPESKKFWRKNDYV